MRRISCGTDTYLLEKDVIAERKNEEKKYKELRKEYLNYRDAIHKANGKAPTEEGGMVIDFVGLSDEERHILEESIPAHMANSIVHKCMSLRGMEMSPPKLVEEIFQLAKQTIFDAILEIQHLQQKWMTNTKAPSIRDYMEELARGRGYYGNTTYYSAAQYRQMVAEEHGIFAAYMNEPRPTTGPNPRRRIADELDQQIDRPVEPPDNEGEVGPIPDF